MLESRDPAEEEFVIPNQDNAKITYTTISLEQSEAFNRAYDTALDQVSGCLGRKHSAFIDGREVRQAGASFESRSPNDTSVVIGSFQECGQSEVYEASVAARQAFPIWSHLPWQERLAMLHLAAENFRTRKYEIAAWLTLEAGKPRIEAMGEVEEAADLITTYSDYMRAHDGFVLPLNQLSPEEVNHSILRPYGVWAVIAPFNFPVALATGMVAGALIGGNTVVFKPSQDTPMCGVLVYECFAHAGLPGGVINLVTGSGDDTGKLMTANENVDGVAFIGSAPVGSQVYREFSSRRPRPVVAEMGGKNPVIVSDHADLEKAVEGTARAAFGYSGQKCSAASRVYVLENIADEFVRRLASRTEELVVGDPTHPDVFAGPVINQDAYLRFQDACKVGRRDGRIVAGGAISTDGECVRGYYCALTVCILSAEHTYFRDELFVPFVSIATVKSFGEALQRANDSEYGLTAGLFSEDQDEIREFLDRIEAGVVYVNRRAGATTGAWPGVQSFGGWKASGSTGKSALGPYYVQQFMREQTQALVTE